MASCRSGLAGLASLALLASGCTHFRMAEQTAPAGILKQRRATQESALILPFRYAPAKESDRDAMTELDVQRWQELLAQTLDASDIFARTSTTDDPQAPARYAISGEIHSFDFYKNWVPTLPLHLAASFFTLTITTWFGAPTTVTHVDFDVTVDVKDLRTGAAVGSFRKQFKSTNAKNIYSSGAKNPYDNPTLVWNDVIGSLATQIAAALPADAELPVAMPAPAEPAPAAEPAPQEEAATPAP
jgi:hypothetical protein